MTHIQALQYFLQYLDGKYILRDDGTIDFEAIAGEFLIEGCDAKEVKEAYDALPELYKRPVIKYDPSLPPIPPQIMDAAHMVSNYARMQNLGDGWRIGPVMDRLPY